MKLGLVSAILDQSDYKEVIDIIAENGMSCVELACWPSGKAERRYAGVSHLDVDTVEENKEEILSYANMKNVEISALAYYPNYLSSDDEAAQASIKHLYKVIKAASTLGINMVTTFIGRNQNKNVEESIEEVKVVWDPIIKYAEEMKVKIAIENCPMLFTADEWPGGQNIFTSPANWRKVFSVLKSDYLGINYDPSHFVWQQIDYITPLYEFKDKIFHVHAKDIKVFKDALNDVGIMATPLEYMSPKLPGLGDVNWGDFISTLNTINYDGHCCIEVEDKSFEGSYEEVLKSVQLSAHYLRNYIAL